MASLLAEDLGLRTGLALYGPDGRLLWYRSQHYGTRTSLRRGAHSLLDACPDVSHLVLEGGGPIADIWGREAGRRGLSVRGRSVGKCFGLGREGSGDHRDHHRRPLSDGEPSRYLLIVLMYGVSNWILVMSP